MSLKRDISILQQAPLFNGLDPEALRLIAFAAEGRTFRSGDVLFREGEVSDGGYVITSGEVAMERRDRSGPELYGPGALLGELAMIVETERPATAVARQTTTALRVTRDMFSRVMQEFPESAMALRDAIARDAQETAGRLSGIRYRLLNIDRDEEQLLKGRA